MLTKKEEFMIVPFEYVPFNYTQIRYEGEWWSRCRLPFEIVSCSSGKITYKNLTAKVFVGIEKKFLTDERISAIISCTTTRQTICKT